MKKITMFFLALILLWSCQEENANTITLGVDVQSFFNHDNIKITIDNKEIINTQLQTNNLLGVCDDGRISIKLSEGNHVIKIVVNNLTTKTEKFSLNKVLYIGINYLEQRKEISLIYSDNPFGYD
jgi:hypothetical protein